MPKKPLSLLMSLFVAALFTVPASAMEQQPSVDEFKAVTNELYRAVAQSDYTGLTGVELDNATAHTLRDAGWDVTVENPEVSLSAIDVDEETKALAYSDLESATPEMQAKIRAAREEIIYASGWTACDSVSTFLLDLRTKEVSILPRFQDLFPGWEVPGPEDEEACILATPKPVASVSSHASELIAKGLSALSETVTIVYNKSVDLYNPGSTMTEPFATPPTLPGNNAFSNYANLFVKSTNYNLGYAKPNGTNLGYQAGLKLFQVYGIVDVPYSMGYIRVRASTNTAEGSGWMVGSRGNMN